MIIHWCPWLWGFSQSRNGAVDLSLMYSLRTPSQRESLAYINKGQEMNGISTHIFPWRISWRRRFNAKKKGKNRLTGALLYSTTVVKVNGITLWSCTKGSLSEVKLFQGHWFTDFHSNIPIGMWWVSQIHRSTLEIVYSNCQLGILRSNKNRIFHRRLPSWGCFPLEAAENSPLPGLNNRGLYWIT